MHIWPVIVLESGIAITCISSVVHNGNAFQSRHRVKILPCGTGVHDSGI